VVAAQEADMTAALRAQPGTPALRDRIRRPARRHRHGPDGLGDRVYNPAELVLLALAGLVIAVASALAPASWAARTRTALALHAE